MSITDSLSIIAVLIAGASFYLSFRTHRSQSNLTRREVELIRIQIEEAKKAHKKEKTAAISARLYKLDRKTWKLKVYNQGPAVAQNVNVILDDQNQIISQSDVDRVFPMTRMEHGQSVELMAFVHMQSPSKEWLLIKWDDPSGTGRENRVEITI
ncbi:MAG: hypothetical protein L3J36_08215 [Rhodobacteraceae bacterium]|nr:hypothetical protein [Paracoccaceae bacterium]